MHKSVGSGGKQRDEWIGEKYENPSVVTAMWSYKKECEGQEWVENEEEVYENTAQKEVEKLMVDVRGNYFTVKR